MSRYLSFTLSFVYLAIALFSSSSWAETPLFETTLQQTGLPLESNTAAQEKPVQESEKSIPKAIQANYEVTKNGQPFARVKEQFTATGNQYKVESVTKGLGVYALLGERRLISNGELNARGLQPTHFELHQGDNTKKSLLADFDWAKKSLTMTVKGKPKTASLLTGTQDLASYAYQFMFMPAANWKDEITVPVTTGKKLNQYRYQVKDQATLEIAGKSYKTIHLIENDPEKTAAESKELWLAVEHHYVPVRIMMTEEGAKLEQTLTELLIEPAKK